jgi:hypothetical protein
MKKEEGGMKKRLLDCPLLDSFLHSSFCLLHFE